METRTQVRPRHVFSTKGSDRGMGTYRMLLLVERNSSGSVGFRLTEAEGSICSLRPFPASHRTDIPGATHHA